MADETNKDHAESVRKAVRRGYELRRDVGPELVETARMIIEELRAVAPASGIPGTLNVFARTLEVHVRRADGLIAQKRYAITIPGSSRPWRWTMAWTAEEACAKFAHTVGGSPPAEELTAVEEPHR